MSLTKRIKLDGHQNALMAGLEVAKSMGVMILSIDADLQDDIQVIPEMVLKLQEGNDIIYGVRKERKTDSWFKRTTPLGVQDYGKDGRKIGL